MNRNTKYNLYSFDIICIYADLTHDDTIIVNFLAYWIDLRNRSSKVTEP